MSRIEPAYAAHARSRPAHRPGPARGGDTSALARRARADELDDRLGLDPDRPGGLPYRLALAALHNPVVTGGAVVSLAMAVAIVANALGNQPRRHPAPLFETRPFAAAPAQAPAPRAAAPAAPSASPSAAAGQPADPVATAAVPRAKPRADGQQLVRDVQAILRDRNLYTGPIDGIPGPATADAIRVLERQLGLGVTGEASERLLAALHGARAAPAPAVAVRTTTVPAPPAPLGRSSGPEPLAPGGDERLQRIQRSLLATGYGPLRTDGRMDERTQDAIRRYELDRGWAVTGRLSDRLVLDVMVQAGGGPPPRQ